MDDWKLRTMWLDNRCAKSSGLGQLGTSPGSAIMPRSQYSRKRSSLGLIALLLILQVTTACLQPLASSSRGAVTDTPISRIERGLLDATDLPLGWRRESTGVPQDLAGGVAKYIQVNHPAFEPMMESTRAGSALQPRK